MSENTNETFFSIANRTLEKYSTLLLYVCGTVHWSLFEKCFKYNKGGYHKWQLTNKL